MYIIIIIIIIISSSSSSSSSSNIALYKCAGMVNMKHNVHFWGEIQNK